MAVLSDKERAQLEAERKELEAQVLQATGRKL